MSRTCINCESRKGMTRFTNESFDVEHAGKVLKVDRLSGWRCSQCDEVEFDAGSAQRYAAAGDDLVLQERARKSQELRRVRQKLRLSQMAAARLTGGGHNAFSRYERGEATPMPAVTNLFRLLDKHPELLSELKEQETRSRPAHQKRSKSAKQVRSKGPAKAMARQRAAS
jgi:HTH-type transcriptional regulator / antitoxin MqsA